MIEQAIAAGRVAANGSAASGVGYSVAVVSTGIRDITLSTPVPAANFEIAIGLGIPNNDAGVISVTHVSDTVKRVFIRARASSAYQDAAFSFLISSFLPSSSPATPTDAQMEAQIVALQAAVAALQAAPSGGPTVYAFPANYDMGPDTNSEDHGRALALSRPFQRTNGTESGGDFLTLPNSDTGSMYGVCLGGATGCTINKWDARMIVNGVNPGDPVLVRLIKNHSVVLSTKTIDGGDTANHTYVESFVLAAGDCVDIYVIEGSGLAYFWELQPTGSITYTPN